MDAKRRRLLAAKLGPDGLAAMLSTWTGIEDRAREQARMYQDLMFDAGCSDAEIAEAAGVSKDCIRMRRKRRGPR